MKTPEAMEQQLNRMSWGKLLDLGYRSQRTKNLLIRRKHEEGHPTPRSARYDEAILRIAGLREAMDEPRMQRIHEMFTLEGEHEQR